MSEIIDATNANAEAIAELQLADRRQCEWNYGEEIADTKLTERVENLERWLKPKGGWEAAQKWLDDPDTAQGAKIRPEHAHRLEQEGRWECEMGCKGKLGTIFHRGVEGPIHFSGIVDIRGRSETHPVKFIPAETPEAEEPKRRGEAVQYNRPSPRDEWDTTYTGRAETPEVEELDLEAIRDWTIDQETDAICDKYEAIIKGLIMKSYPPETTEYAPEAEGVSDMSKYVGMPCWFSVNGMFEPGNSGWFVGILGEIDKADGVCNEEYLTTRGNVYDFCRPHPISKEVLELREKVARGAEVIDDLLAEKDKEIERLKGELAREKALPCKKLPPR